MKSSSVTVKLSHGDQLMIALWIAVLLYILQKISASRPAPRRNVEQALALIPATDRQRDIDRRAEEYQREWQQRRSDAIHDLLYQKYFVEGVIDEPQ